MHGLNHHTYKLNLSFLTSFELSGLSKHPIFKIYQAYISRKMNFFGSGSYAAILFSQFLLGQHNS
jgi:hypothetical protein